MSAKVAWSFNPPCVVEGCPERAGWTTGNECAFHHLISLARGLSPERFDRLRTTLTTTEPLTEEERRVRRMRSALRRLEWTSRDLKRANKDARDAGATEEQIADAADKLTSDSQGPL